jgi:hypothetical protein
LIAADSTEMKTATASSVFYQLDVKVYILKRQFLDNLLGKALVYQGVPWDLFYNSCFWLFIPVMFFAVFQKHSLDHAGL